VAYIIILEKIIRGYDKVTNIENKSRRLRLPILGIIGNFY
jgi:hypothetical protein